MLFRRRLLPVDLEYGLAPFAILGHLASNDIEVKFLQARGRISQFACSDEAMIDRVVHLGFEVRVEFTLKDGAEAWSQLTREEADRLELEQGQIVYVRKDGARVFSGSPE